LESIFEAQVVGIPFSQKISFTQIGIQASKVSVFGVNQFTLTKLNAQTFVLYFSIRERKYSHTC
jgi:hypothetical protein